MCTNPIVKCSAETLLCCLLWYILLVHVLPLILPVCIIYYVCKLIEMLFFWCSYKAIAFSSVDSLWMRERPENRIIINALLIAKGDVDIGRFKEMLFNKLRLDDNSTANPYMKAKKRVRYGFLHYYWIDDEDFNISNHVKLWPKLIVTKKNLQMLISELCTKEFNMSRSPWDYTLISFLDDDKIFKTVFHIRMHHCIADGISLARFLVHELSDSSVVTVPLKKFSETSRIFMMVKGLFWLPFFLVNLMTTRRDESILHGSKLEGTKAVTWSDAIDLDLVKDIKNKNASTVNDVLVSVMSAALAQFFKNRNIVLTDDIKVSIPIDLRSNMDAAAIKFKNHITVVPFELPTSIPHPLVQLEEMKKRSKELKTSGEPFALWLAMEICTRVVPVTFLEPLNRFLCEKTTGVLSNLPGPQSRITICGREMTSLAFWAPQRDNIGLSFSFATYANELFVGVQSDVKLLEDPDEICNEFYGKLVELQKCLELNQNEGSVNYGVEITA